MSLHLTMADDLDAALAEQLTAPVERRQDALILRLTHGITLTVHYVAADAYSLRWSNGHSQARIDTAPLHPQLATFPNHLHDADGMLRADPLTRTDAAPLDNIRAVVTALLGPAPSLLHSSPRRAGS